MAVAPDGRVLVTNTRNASISVFRDGKLERTLAGPGTRDGELRNPHDIEAASDAIILRTCRLGHIKGSNPLACF